MFGNLTHFWSAEVSAGVNALRKKRTVQHEFAATTKLTQYVFGYDRITLWLDHPELPIGTERLRRHCTDITVTSQQMPYQARWKLKVEILQPTSTCLQQLLEALGKNVGTSVNYVEFDCDVPADTGKLARKARNAFLAAARVRYQRKPFEPFETTWYCGDRDSPGTLAVYADKPSKLHNARPAPDAAPCLHVEKRVSGSASLERLGVVTLDDLIQFNHEQFWNRHILIYALPKSTALGRLLAKVSGADTAVSGSALRKRSARWVDGHTEEDKFVMHNALLAEPKLARGFERRLFTDWLKTTGAAARED